MTLYDILVKSALAGIALMQDDGSMPNGHNGPYGDPETPVRNTAHWSITFAKAYEIMDEVRNEEMNTLREYQQDLTSFVLSSIPDSRLNGHPTKRLASHNNFSFKGINGFDLISELDHRGFAVSTGSACIAQSDEISHVIQALKLPVEYQQGTLRVSTGRFNRSNQIKSFKIALEESIQKLRD